MFLSKSPNIKSKEKILTKKPKTKSFPLIECEFPPLTELNKLGDGSLRSANQVNDVCTQQCFLLFVRGYALFEVFFFLKRRY